MITVNVHYHNTLRRATGAAEEAVTLPDGSLLRDVLEYLQNHHEPALREMLFAPDGSIAPHLVIFRNRRLVPPAQRPLTLADGDDLMLFPAIAGG